MSDTYQGHANYPTWAILLWLNNDHGMYCMIQEFSDYVFDEFFEDGDEVDVTYEIAERFEEYISSTFIFQEELLDERAAKILTSGVVADLLGFSVGMIDWYEVAESLLNDIKEDRDYQASQD